MDCVDDRKGNLVSKATELCLRCNVNVPKRSENVVPEHDVLAVVALWDSMMHVVGL